MDNIFRIVDILNRWRCETMEIYYCRTYWCILPLTHHHHWNINDIYCGHRVNIVFIVCNYSDMLSIEKTQGDSAEPPTSRRIRLTMWRPAECF